jgi:hypothetical protein
VLALAPFSDRTDGQWMLWTGCPAGEGLTRLLADSLARGRGWELADGAERPGGTADHDLPGATDAARAAWGRRLGAGWVVCGTVTAFGVDAPAPDPQRRRWSLPPGRRVATARVTLELRVIETATGTVRRSERVTRERLLSGASSAREHARPVAPLATDGTPLGEALREAVAACATVLEQEALAHWSTRVVRVRGDRVELDAGRASGLVPGARLTVWRTGIAVMGGDGELVASGPDEMAAELEVEDFTADGRRARARILRGRAWTGDTARPWSAWTPRAFAPPGERSAR